ncbi:VOC family protein [Roseisolibacter sp. H3M3-2]|uniref:VOC family protein n=1 Tax=Roseisolibacter sp. H3M3-2 TaxID=3031323 RepID=UPI0023DAEF2A|nr:VOC family protein [Roseisolibacter sp. H3M3-2]MDF1501609.1 VOC family protein [Roseisolibacter sp. H3M3-2]
MTADDGVRLGRIGQVAMTVRDLPGAVRFYRDALGLPFLFEAPPALAFFDCGGVRLMLSAPDGGGEAGKNSVLYFAVPDIRAAYDGLRGRGVVFVDEPHLIARLPDREVWMCFLRDPDENLLGLMSEIPVG